VHDHVQSALHDAIARAAETFRTEAPRARATFRSESALGDGFRAEAPLRTHALTVDEPDGIGGGDAGPTPVELALAAHGACQEITRRAFATAARIPPESAAVDVDGDIDFRGFFAVDPAVRPGFRRIRVHVTLGSTATEADLARLIAMVTGHCPVRVMLTTPVAVCPTQSRR
jgi:uncharacterized OsmC-like protein